MSTHSGVIKDYNEDRTLAMLRCSYEANQTVFSLFGVFDGHGGHNCAEFIQTRLARFVGSNKYFPSDPAKAL